MLSLFNTLSRRIEEITVEPGRAVRLYSCGPTVYDRAHIGNLRSFIFADLLARVLKHEGHAVRWVMNITDIDDKTIQGAIRQFGAGATVSDLATFTSRYTESFLQDLAKVGVDVSAIEITPISTLIAQMGKFINALIAKGYAYTAENGDVYFNIQKYNEDFGDYGALVGSDFLEGKKTGARVAVDEYNKDNVSDFALWKAHNAQTDGNIFWQAQGLAPGRPGWHIECSVLNNEAFGAVSTDIHTGGVDLIFPHHANEMAQSQPFYRPFARYWCHSEHLLVDGAKMSKSLANFYTLDDVESRGMDARALRYLLLTSHYRTRSNFTWEALQAAAQALKKLDERFAQLPTTGGGGEVKTDGGFLEKFTGALDDDLNSAAGLAVIWEVLKSDLDPGVAGSLLATFNQVLGLGLGTQPAHGATIPADILAKIEAMINERQNARAQKDFARADSIRTEIDALLTPLGKKLEDTPDGPVISS